jgi:hypothetical protein
VGHVHLKSNRRAHKHGGTKPMWIMVVYILIVVVAEFVVIVIGLVLDRIYPALSLTVSLSLFFLVLWLGWVLAVRVTEPKHATNKKHAI